MDQDVNSSDRVSIAQKLENSVKQINSQINNSLSIFELGKLLKEIRDGDLYKELGYDTITEWFSSPEIDISRAWGYSFISFYEVFILQLKKNPEDLPSDYTKLRDILSVVRKFPEKVDDLLEQAMILRRADFKRVIREIMVQASIEKNKDEAKVEVFEEKKLFENVEGGTINCIITQPDYLINNSYKGVVQFGYEKKFVNEETQRLAYDDFAFRSYEGLKKGGNIFLFVKPHNLVDITKVFTDRGFILMNIIAWNGGDQKPADLTRFVDSNYIVWMCKITKVSWIIDYESSIWNIANKQAVVKKILEAVTVEGDAVIDPYYQDDAVEKSCKLLGRSYLPYYFDLTK